MNPASTCISLAVATLITASLTSGQQFRDAPGTGAPAHSPYWTLAADLDRDGDLDVVSSGRPGPIRILINDGKGAFTDESIMRLPRGSSASTWQVRAADIDNDGDPDLITANAGSTPNQLFLNTGFGMFTDASYRFGLAPRRSESVAVLDIDGDRDLDIYFVNENKIQDQLLVNDGKGGFTNVTATHVPAYKGSGNVWAPNRVLVGDFDCDGDPDLFFLYSGATLENDGKGKFKVSTTIRLRQVVGSNPVGHVADFNGDGRDDVWLPKPISLVLSLGGGKFVEVGRTNLPRQAVRELPQPCDVDLDGDVDIFGGNTLLLNDGNAKFTDASARLDNTVRRFDPFAVAADFDLDGDPDLLVPDIGKLQTNYHRQIQLDGKVRIGSPLTLQVFSQPGYLAKTHIAIPLFATGELRTKIAPFGTLGLDPRTMVTGGPLTLTGPQGQAALGYRIPYDQRLIGIKICHQALIIAPGELRLTNTIAATVHQ